MVPPAHAPTGGEIVIVDSDDEAAVGSHSGLPSGHSLPSAAMQHVPPPPRVPQRGDRIQLNDLVKSVDYNGATGTVQGLLPKGTKDMHWAIRLDDPELGYISIADPSFIHFFLRTSHLLLTRKA